MTKYRRSMVIIGLAVLVCGAPFFQAGPASGEDGTRLVYDDGTFKVFVVGGGGEGPEQAVDPLAKPRVKVHVAYTGTTNSETEIYPWFIPGEMVYHKVLGEIRGGSDMVKAILKVKGPNRYRQTYVSTWLGPYDPGAQIYAVLDPPVSYNRLGLYKSVAIVKPQSNKRKGASGDFNRFRIEAP